MTFTYSGDPNVSARDKVRFLIGDTFATDAHLQDEEIAWLLSVNNNDVWETARAGAEHIAIDYAHKANYSKTVGDLAISEQFRGQADEFYKLSDRIKSQRFRQSPPSPVANAAALVSTDDRNVSDYNTDFYVGQMDNPNTDTDSLIRRN